MSTNQCVQISTTADRVEVLESIARRLVQQRLAACVQFSGPVTSVYRWQGKLEQTREWVCQIKTSADRADDVIRCIGQWHPYDNPELIVTPIVGGSADYLQWIGDQVDAESHS